MDYKQKLKNAFNFALAWVGLNPKKATIILLVLVGLFLARCALAESVRLTWTNPTTYTNGTAIPAGALNGIQLRCVSFQPQGGASGACPNGLTNVIATPAQSSGYNLDLGAVPAGGGTYTFTARARSPGTGTANVFSVDSNAATQIFAVLIPNPPTGLGVTVVTAFNVKFDASRFAFKLGKPVGTVPLGTACSTAFQLEGGYYKVDRDDVEFNSSRNRDPMIVAKCG